MVSVYRKYVEMILLYVGMPIFILFTYKEIPLLLILMILGILIYIFLKKDKSFDKSIFKKFKIEKSELKRILFVFTVSVIAMVFLIYFIDKNRMFFLLRNRPWFLLIISIFYPIFSVITQTLAYRVFFFHRYSSLFKNKYIQIIVSAAFFSFAHILYKNLFVLLLTFVAGLIFSYTYYNNKSFLVSFLEHSLYGIWLFASGLGMFFVSAFVK